MSDPLPALHDVEWTGGKIARFWNQYAALADHDETYFSKLVGAALLRMVSRHNVSLTGRILDFGCGPGHLLDLLSNYGGSYQGVDYSAVSVEAARKRLAGRRGFAGVQQVEALPTPLPSGQFDVAFLIETVEHLLPEQRAATLREVARLLVPGGTLVVTVPNEENLDLLKVACPDCGCVFHRVQHVSTWSGATLSALLAEHGFQTRLCKGTRLASRGLLGAGMNLARLLVGKGRPHLVCIAQKR
jgi:SAM-dependent methyltransferase